MQRARPYPLAQKAYDRLVADIASHRRRAGDRLVEAYLAREINVSRTPIREALGRLERDGLVTPVRPHGYVVRTPSLQDIRDLHEIRRALEPLGFANVVRNARPEDDAEFNRLVEGVQQANDPDSSAATNKKLRAFWMSRISNGRMRELLSRYHLQTQIVRVATLDSAEGRAAARAGTKRLRDAYLARDPAAAEAAMADFVDTALRFFEAAYDETPCAGSPDPDAQYQQPNKAG